jgi:hypothetical protein
MGFPHPRGKALFSATKRICSVGRRPGRARGATGGGSTGCAARADINPAEVFVFQQVEGIPTDL